MFSIKVSSCTLSTYGLYRIAVVLGPYMASTALIWIFNLDPMSLVELVGQIEKMLPTEKLISMIELPSKGS